MFFASLCYRLDAVVTPGTRHMTDPTAHTHDAVLRDNLERAQASVAREPSPPKLSQAFNGRWTRRHWAHASLFATMGMLVAAIVPGFSTAMQVAPNTQRTVLSLALPQVQLRNDDADLWQS